MIKLKTNLKFIITGTGRCGTVYMARLFTLLGIPCGHESIFNYNETSTIKRVIGLELPTVSGISESRKWLQNLNGIIADSSYMAVPYLHLSTIKNLPIIHVVREPFATISSFVKDFGYFQLLKKNPFNSKGWENWIFSKVPELYEIENPIERACYYYYKWNKLIENEKNIRKYYFKRIEDNIFDELFDFLSVEKKEISLPDNVNSKKKRTSDITESEIPDGEIKDMFMDIKKEYGYTS